METRCLHITGNQALTLMRAARARRVVTARPCDVTHVQPAAKTLSSLDDPALSRLLLWLNVGSANPLEVLVPNAHERAWTKGVKTTVLSREVPTGAFLELGDGLDAEQGIRLPSNVRVFVDAPPLALVHAALALQRRVFKSPMGELEARLRLIALASEFCGSYARDPLHPFAKRGYFDKPHEEGRFLSLAQLSEFLEQAPAMDGVALARSVAKYAIDGSGSPIETYLNLAWTLPPRMAGLSMARPLVNKQLVVKDEAKARLLKHDSLRPDFQWPDLNVVAEYLGDRDHSSHGARVEDKDRLQDYVAADYKAFFLMFDDVKSVASLNRTAMMLAREFAKGGKTYEPYRIRRIIEDKTFKERQVLLVKTLLPPVMRYEEVDL